MATSFFYIYEMATSFFIYIDIYKKADRTWGNSWKGDLVVRWRQTEGAADERRHSLLSAASKDASS